MGHHSRAVSLAPQGGKAVNADQLRCLRGVCTTEGTPRSQTAGTAICGANGDVQLRPGKNGPVHVLDPGGIGVARQLLRRENGSKSLLPGLALNMSQGSLVSGLGPADLQFLHNGIPPDKG